MNLRQDEIRQKRDFRCLVITILVLLLPVFIIALYNRPSADDYTYGQRTYAALQQYGFNLPKLVAAAWDSDMYFFNNWQGLYSSGFLLALQPAIFGTKWYALTTFLVVGILYVSLWALFRCLARQLLPGTRYVAPTMALLFTYAFVEGMPNQVEGLYWFNGAMNYIPYFALTLISTGILTGMYFQPAKSLPTAKAVVRTVVCCVLCALISGGHQVVSALNLLLLLILIAVYARKKRFWPVLPFLSGLIGLVVNITSPGTRVRTSGFSSASMPEAIIKSFILAALEWIRWLDVPLLCLLVLLTPVLLRLVKSDRLSDRIFRFPLWPLAVTFVLMWGMIWLPSYTMGGIGPGRLINIVWMTFVLGLSTGYACLLGWLTRIRGVSAIQSLASRMKKHPRKVSLACVAMLLCMGCIGSHTVKEGLDNHFATSLEALYELGEGTPQAYAAALDERDAVLRDSSQPDVTIRPLTDEEKPYLLYFSDVTPGPDRWGLTTYYGKNSIEVKQ
ncbi:MAG: DUF6056 family protein [Gemmiger sp.]